MKTIIRSVAAMVVASALGAGAAQAAQIVLAPSNVVGVYGNFDGFSTGGRIFDKQTGVINEAFGTDYWINSDNSPADAFLTVDLLTAYDPGTFELFNTNNGGVGDRGTANFSIVGGNAVSAFAGGLRLTGPEILLVNGTLDRVFGNIRTSQTFASAVSGGVRYLEFRPTSTVAGTVTSVSYGLSEMRVFTRDVNPGAIPEPATWAMMIIGFGAVGSMVRSRRRALA